MPQRLNSYFGNSELRQLSRRADMLASLQQRYRETAPSSLAGASHVIGLEHRILTLGADNGAVAAKLRQIAPQLVQQLQATGVEVTGIRVKVQVGNLPPRRTLPKRSINIAAKRQLNDFASNLADSPLRTALQHLVKKS